jgi:hypothetical protein
MVIIRDQSVRFDSRPMHNERLQRTGISVSLIENLLHYAVVARPLKRGVMQL